MAGNNLTYFNTPPTNSFYPWHHHSGANVGGVPYDVTSCIADRLMATPVGPTANSFVYPLSGQLNPLQIQHHHHPYQQQQQQQRYNYQLQQSQQTLSDALLSQTRISAIDDNKRSLLPAFFQAGNRNAVNGVDQDVTDELTPSTRLLPASLIKRSTSVTEFLQTTNTSSYEQAAHLSKTASGHLVSVPSSSSLQVEQLSAMSGSVSLIDRVPLPPPISSDCFSRNEDRRRTGNMFTPAYGVTTAAAASTVANNGAVRQLGLFSGSGASSFQTKTLMSSKVRGSRTANFINNPRSHSGW